MSEAPSFVYDHLAAGSVLVSSGDKAEVPGLGLCVSHAVVRGSGAPSSGCPTASRPFVRGVAGSNFASKGGPQFARTAVRSAPRLCGTGSVRNVMIELQGEASVSPTILGVADAGGVSLRMRGWGRVSAAERRTARCAGAKGRRKGKEIGS